MQCDCQFRVYHFALFLFCFLFFHFVFAYMNVIFRMVSDFLELIMSYFCCFWYSFSFPRHFRRAGWIRKWWVYSGRHWGRRGAGWRRRESRKWWGATEEEKEEEKVSFYRLCIFFFLHLLVVEVDELICLEKKAQCLIIYIFYYFRYMCIWLSLLHQVADRFFP